MIAMPSCERRPAILPTRPDSATAGLDPGSLRMFFMSYSIGSPEKYWYDSTVEPIPRSTAAPTRTRGALWASQENATP